MTLPSPVNTSNMAEDRLIVEVETHFVKSRSSTTQNHKKRCWFKHHGSHTNTRCVVLLHVQEWFWVRESTQKNSSTHCSDWLWFCCRIQNFHFHCSNKNCLSLDTFLRPAWIGRSVRVTLSMCLCWHSRPFITVPTRANADQFWHCAFVTAGENAEGDMSGYKTVLSEQ